MVPHYHHLLFTIVSISFVFTIMFFKETQCKLLQIWLKAHCLKKTKNTYFFGDSFDGCHGATVIVYHCILSIDSVRV